MSTKETHTNTLLRALLTGVAVLLLCGICSGAAAAAIPETVTTVSTVEDLESVLTGASGFNIKLGGSLETFQLTKECTIKTEGVLDLNGKIIRAAPGSRLFIVESGGVGFTIKDSAPDAVHSTPVTYQDPVTRESVTVNGGCLTGGGGCLAGGGVYVRGGIFNLKGGSIAGNTAEYEGGGVYVMNEGTFTMSDGSIAGNAAGYNGGGVNVNDGKFFLNSGSIAGNTANHEGGGVYVNAGKFFLNSGSISGNTAGYNGGGVYVRSGASFTMNYGSISSNTANHEGGGVYVDGGTVDRKDGTFTVSGDSKINGNTVNGSANNVYLYTADTLTLVGTFTGEIRISKVNHIPIEEGKQFGLAAAGVTSKDAEHITNDSESLCGTVDGGKLIWTPLPKLINFKNKQYTKDTIIGGEGSPFTAENAVYNKDTNTLTLQNTVTLDSTLIAIYPQSKKPFTIDLNGNALQRKSDAASFSVLTVAEHAGLVVRDSSSSGSGCITGGKAENGGGVYISTNGAFTLDSGSIKENTATYGGAVYVNPDSTFTMNNGNLAGNTVHNEGGAVFAAGRFRMNDGNITDNRSSFGGGVYVEKNGTFEMKGGSITGNSAGGDAVHGYGGGVCVWTGGRFIISGTPQIKENIYISHSNHVNNVQTNGHLITIGEGGLKEGASIGIANLQTSPVSGKPLDITSPSSKDYSSFFFSDTPAKYQIQSSGSAGQYVVQLATIGTGKCTITYHENGGTIGTAPASRTYSEGEKATIASHPEAMIRDGFTFMCWNTAEDGRGQDYAENQDITIEKKHTPELHLYAIWAEEQLYDVLARSDGNGTVTSNPARAQAGTTITLTLLPETGYMFDHWEFIGGITKEDMPEDNMSFKMPPKNVEIKAHFKESFVVSAENGVLSDAAEDTPADNAAAAGHDGAFTVTYHKNGGNGSIPVDHWKYSDGDIVTVLQKPDNLVRDGYTFRNWNTEIDGTGSDYVGGDEFHIHNDTTLYADWQKDYLYDIMILTTGHGTVTTTPVQAAAGKDVLIHVTPDPGYQLVDGIYSPGINQDEIKRMDDNTYTFRMPANHVKITAVFDMIPSPAPKKESTPQGSSIWLTAAPTPTATPTPAPTVTETPDVPQVKPVTPTGTPAKTPAPFLGVLAGLGCAAVVFGLRMRR